MTEQPQKTSFAERENERLKDMPTPREFGLYLSRFLPEFGDDKAKERALENMLYSVATMSMSSREGKLRPNMPIRLAAEPTYQRAFNTGFSAQLPAGKHLDDYLNEQTAHIADADEKAKAKTEIIGQMRDRALNEILNPVGYTEVLTPHPTSTLNKEVIEKIHDLQKYMDGLSDTDFVKLLKDTKQKKGDSKLNFFLYPYEEKLNKHIKAVAEAFKPGIKLKPNDESARASYFAKQRFDAIPLLLARQDRAWRTQQEDGMDIEGVKGLTDLSLQEKIDRALPRYLKQQGREPYAVKASQADGSINLYTDAEHRKHVVDDVKQALAEFGNIKAAYYDPDAKYIERFEPVSLEFLKGQERLLQCFSWQGDRDSKPEVTAERIEDAVKLNTQKTHEWYRQGLDNLIAEIELANVKYAHITDPVARQQAQLGREVVAALEKAEHFTHGDELRASLEKIKEEFEAKHFIFPRLKEKKGEVEVPTRLSALDALYVQVLNGGDCYPKVEIRQNSVMHRNVLEHVITLIRDNPELGGPAALVSEWAKRLDKIPDDTEPANIRDRAAIYSHLMNSMLGLAKEEDGIVAAYIREKVDSYAAEVQTYYKLKTPEEQAAYKEQHEGFKDRLECYETLKGVELTSRYPDAIKSYVIAETGVMDKEQAYVESIKDIGKRRDFVAETARKDVLTVLCFKELMTSPEMRAKHPNAMSTQVIPLLENRQAIISADVLFKQLYENEHFKAYAKQSFHHKAPEIYDPKTNGYRTMTVADAKRSVGNKNILKSDENRKLKGSLCVMFAGSDSMRENGICIQPLNAYNQEQLVNKAIEQGYWVEIYQGVGGAVHRSNPAFFGASRATAGQGAANHYYTAESIANRVEGHHSSHAMGRLGHVLPEAKNSKTGRSVKEMAAIFPGHVGNTLQLPKESDEAIRKAYAPLEEGCKAHAKLFEDPLFNTFIEKDTALEFTKLFNFSARGAARVNQDGFKASSLRAIGYNLSHFAMGTNTTLWKGIEKFIGLKEDGSFNKKETIELIKSSSKIQDMMTRVTFGMALADFDMAWRFQGMTRGVAANGEVIVTNTHGGYATVDALANAKMKIDNGADDSVIPAGFTRSALMLADFDNTFHKVGAAVLETYMTMQAEGKELTDAQKNRVAHFEPKMMLDIMLPEMREEVGHYRKELTDARHVLADAQRKLVPALKAKGADKAAIEKSQAYQDAENAFRTVEEILETSTHESLNRISRTFNNRTVDVYLNNGAQAALNSAAPYVLAM